MAGLVPLSHRLPVGAPGGPHLERSPRRPPPLLGNRQAILRSLHPRTPSGRSVTAFRTPLTVRRHAFPAAAIPRRSGRRSGVRPPGRSPHLARKYPGGAGAGPRSRLLRPPDAARGASGSGWGSGGHPPASAGVAPARLRSRRGHRRRLGRARCRPGASVLPSPPHPDPRCSSVAIRRTPSCGATTDTFRKIPHPSRSAAPWRASCRARRARRGGRFSAGAPTGSGGWARLTPFGDPAPPRGTVPRPPIAREPPLSPPGAPRRSS